ncbi:hypothetical protein EsDP_00007474, partial [Epichloe bromicola]
FKPEGTEAVKQSGLRLRGMEPVMKDGSVISDDDAFWKATWETLIGARLQILKKRGLKISSPGPTASRINAWIPMPPDGPGDDQTLSEDMTMTPVSHKGRLYMGADKEHEHQETKNSKVERPGKRKRHDTSQAQVPELTKRKLLDCPPHELKMQLYQESATQAQQASSVIGRQPRRERNRKTIAKSSRDSPRLTAKAAPQPSSRHQLAQPVRRSARIAARNRSASKVHTACGATCRS